MSRYRPVQRLGRGGFGTEILVIDELTKEQKVIKKIEMQKLLTESQAACREEAKLSARLKHENIVQFYDSFEENGMLYIVMEYCRGSDLERKVNSRLPPLPEEQIWRYFIQICLGLNYLHGNNILHRDIKPANIFLTWKGKVIVIGVSKCLSLTSELANTFVGTPLYMSPEMLNGYPYSSKSEVWALGCVLYKMATGNVPFPENVIWMITSSPHIPLPNTCSLELRLLVDEMLNKSPAARPSVAEILQKPIVKSFIAVNNLKMSRYRHVQRLGRGGFGTEILVVDELTKEQKVIKKIEMQKLPTRSQAACRDEATVLARLKHENIVEFYDSFEENGMLYIVMEYCGGGDLEQRILSCLLPEEQIWSYFIQICLALNYLLGNNIFHRDIKPANILLTSYGKVKLADFGVSKCLQPTSELANTFVGTLWYMSPEMLNGYPYSRKSDVWALGCVLYKMATGNVPFPADNETDLKRMVTSSPHKPLPDTCSLELRLLVDEMLNKSPDARPSVAEILQKPIVKSFIAVNNLKMSRYQRVRELGRGGFGAAILVVDELTKEQKVIKEIEIEKLPTRSQAACRDEAKLLARLKHENIVEFYDSFEENGMLYIVMEYCGGGDLEQRILSCLLPLPDEQIWSYFIQICLALNYLHGDNILHRDIKPANIFLTAYGKVKLADFGVSKCLQPSYNMAATYAGTQVYMSPEMFKSQLYDEKTDIWSLGCVLHKMVTRTVPVLTADLTFPPMSFFAPYTLELKQMINELLNNSPTARPSVAQILRKLPVAIRMPWIV